LAPAEAVGATVVCGIGAPRLVKVAKPSKSWPSVTRSMTAKVGDDRHVRSKVVKLGWP
jgi:hypothetical protein